VEGKQVGDPLEQAALKGVGWSYTQDERALAKPGKGAQKGAQILHRFHFASHLKRMSVLTKLLEVGGELAEGYFVLVKVRNC
jgi:cation-transporting ATPase 13A1